MLLVPPPLWRPAPRRVFQQTASDTADLTNYSFASQPFGAPRADRHIVLAIHSFVDAARTISSVTIGGVSATPVAFVQTGTSREISALYIAKVPTGATGTVAVNFSGQMLACQIGIWAVYDLVSATPDDTGTSSASPGAFSLDTVAKGLAFGVGTRLAGTSAAWTGLTEDWDVSASGGLYTGASIPTTGAAIPVSLAYTGGTEQPATVAASFH